MTTVVIPWRDDGHRARACRYVCDTYRAALPGVRLLLVDSGHQPFNRSASRNVGVSTVVNADDADEVVVVGDADTLPDPHVLRYVIGEAASRGGLHYPYSICNYLTERGTEVVFTSRRLAPEHVEFSIPAAQGGVMVMRAREWTALGGMDTRFTGWGYEDNAWYRTVLERLGRPTHHNGLAWHLWHPHDRYAGTAEQEQNRLLATNG